MDKTQEVLEQALEALEHIQRCIGLGTATIYYGSSTWEQSDQAITALRERLAQPAQQQPYGWKVYGVNSLFMGEFAEADAKAEARRIGGTCIAFPLYTSPRPAQRKPLSQAEVVEGFCKQPHDVQFVSVFNAGVRFAEAAHGIGEKK